MQGLGFLYQNEIAARLEVYSLIWALGIYFIIGTPLHLIVLSAVLFFIMFSVEALNTAIEVIVDRISPEISETGKNAKDLGSLAVFCLIIVNLGFFAYAILQTNDVLMRLSSPNTFIIASLFLALFAVYSFLRIRPIPKAQYLVVFILGLVLIGSGVFIVSNYFTGKGFDESVLYHLKVGFDGAGYAEYRNIILFALLYIFAALSILFLTFDLLGKRSQKISKKTFEFVNERYVTQTRSRNKTGAKGLKKASQHLYITGILALAIAVIINPITSNIISLLPLSKGQKGNISIHEFYKKAPILTKGNGKNVVFIYLEGLERTYLDEDIFPGLTPNLKRIEAESLSYSDIRHVYGTGFTIAGLVSSQCGVPIYTLGNSNSMDQYDQFMPNINCLGDILKENNYHMEYMGGAQLKFAGKGSFLGSHGFDTIKGEGHFKNIIEDEDAFHNWGLHDEYLVDSVINRYEELLKTNQPFGLFTLTVNTHHPRGHPSPRCENPDYQDGGNSLLNSVKCTDQLVGKFVDEIKRLDTSGNTIIVIASDHLAMRNIATDSLKKGTRRNLFMVVNSDNSGQKDTPASTLDIGPTVLESLGFENEGLGFGRSLTSNTDTLISSFPDSYNQILKTSEETLAPELWAFPRFKDVVSVDLEKQQISFGDRWMNIPILVELTEEDLNIKRFMFSHPNPKRNKGFIESRMTPEKPYFWVDKCTTFPETLQLNLELQNEKENQLELESEDIIASEDVIEDVAEIEEPMEKWCIAYGLPEAPTFRELESFDKIARWDIEDTLNVAP